MRDAMWPHWPINTNQRRADCVLEVMQAPACLPSPPPHTHTHPRRHAIAHPQPLVLLRQADERVLGALECVALAGQPVYNGTDLAEVTAPQPLLLTEVPAA